MPAKPKRPCSYPGCPRLTNGRYCEEHAKLEARRYEKYDRDPVTRKRYGRRWRQIRSRYIAAHPLCEKCRERGKLTPAQEVHHSERPKICLLDDNFLGHPNWSNLLTALQQTQRPFQFNQGLDERLLTGEKCAALFSSRYDGDFIFAFDDAADAALIEQKLQLARKYTNAILKFYCFCGYDRAGAWGADFWKRDIFELLFRIATLARWCNQPSFFKKKNLWEFAESNGRNSACFRYVDVFATQFPEALPFYTMKFE